MAKVLKEEMAKECITKIQDDIVIGGENQMEAARNYVRVLQKLDLANLKVEPQKVNIFPESADIAGWVWCRGGYLTVSPHQQNSLKNVRQDSIKKVKHLRSYIGLYKTLQMAAPAVSRVLAPLEQAVAGKESAEPIVWDNALSQRFREAKSHVRHVHTLYLPHPQDQLVIKSDAASYGPGIGHTVYAIKDKELKPVRFHSSRLNQHCQTWQSCELEGLSISVAINTEYNLLRESKQPIIILADNKAVADAIRLIQAGKFRTAQQTTNKRQQTTNNSQARKC